MTFAALGVPGQLVHILADDGKRTAFPIQQDTLPDSLAGRDILGRGRTGSGKTLAFCLPLVARLGAEGHAPRPHGDETPHPRGLILAPTRELANQINDVLAPLADAYGLRTTTVYGGVRYNRQIADLKAGADIVVACPGRLEDLIDQGVLTLADVEVVVLDEADEMADMGFLPSIRRLLGQIAPDAQHMLLSATLDHGVDAVVEEFLHDPKVHSVDDATSAVDLMTHHVFLVNRNDKHELVRVLASGQGRRILFTRTKFQAKKLAHNLVQQGIPAAELHGNLNQNQRDRNLQAFESGEVNVLVATDVAARGIDVSGVDLVVQVEPPEDPKSFTHRSGRTARAGKAGDVVTIVTPDQKRMARSMLRQAGIHVTPLEVRPDSPQVLELRGEVAPLVEGWTLPELKRKRQQVPGGSGRRRQGGRGRQGGPQQNAHHPKRSPEAAKERRRRRAQEREARREAERQGNERLGADQRAFAESMLGDVHSLRGEGEGRDGRRRDDRFEERQGAKGHGHGNGRGKGSNPRYDGHDRRGRDDRDGRGEYWDGKKHRSERRAADWERDERRGGKGKGGKRTHRREQPLVRDERGEDAKRHERRMQARQQPRKMRQGKHRTGAPFRTGRR
ncbi:MAG: DEAD/DEAH box helicase [Bifidobacterium sp.]|nr:DEAD/DEAH box helicase [Bifidobacterium sp.]